MCMFRVMSVLLFLFVGVFAFVFVFIFIFISISMSTFMFLYVPVHLREHMHMYLQYRTLKSIVAKKIPVFQRFLAVVYSVALTFWAVESPSQKSCLTTAGAVNIATAHRKRSGIKIEISPLTNMIETSGFFLYTHICNSNVSERRCSDIFNRFLDM